MKTTANQIKEALTVFVKGNYDVVLPNFFYGANECDIFRVTENDYVFEYEIKISRADFFADFKKTARGENKHDRMAAVGTQTPNRFFFVVPENLVTVEEVPAYAGLIYFKNGRLSIIKTGKLLHKNKFTDYRSICHTLCNTVHSYRIKIRKQKINQYENELTRLRAEKEGLRKERNDLRMELLILRGRKSTITELTAQVSDTTADATRH